MLGRKIGMTQVYNDAGVLKPVTVLEVGPCTVLQVKTVKTDGYAAVQLGFADKLRRKASKPESGHVKKVNAEPKKYIREVRGPGPELAGAQWLSSHGIFAAGSDTIAFEKVPARNMPVHVHLLVEKGIHIIEALDLEELARVSVAEFLFVAAPLRIRGGTGSPVRALALVIPQTEPRP